MLRLISLAFLPLAPILLAPAYVLFKFLEVFFS
jgi:hypothetical protein